MSDSNQDHERNPRFSRALLGRILAVGLFVGLGTFAVIHLMNSGEKTPTKAAVAEGTPNPDGTLPPSPESTPPAPKNTAIQSPALTNNAVSNPASSFNPTATPPSTPPIRSAVLSPPDVNASRSAFQPSQPPIQSGNNQNPASAFEPIKAPPMLATKPPTQPVTQSPAQLAPVQPSNTAPIRFAQLPGSGAAGAGIAAVDPRSPAPPNNFAPNLVNDTSAKAKDALNDFGNRLANTSNDLRAEGQQIATNMVDGLKDKSTLSNGQPVPGANNLPPSAPSSLVPTAPKTFTPSPLPNQLPTSQGLNQPTMQAPVPVNVGLDSGSGLRPINNGFSDNPNKAANPAASPVMQSFPGAPPNQAAPIAGNDRLNGINQIGNGPTVQSKSNFGPDNSARPQIPAQAASVPLNNSRPEPALSTAPPRTTNVPGDRQLEGVQSPALTVEKLSPREIQVNQPADFEIVVRNVGRANAEDVQVHDQIPAGTEFLGAAPKETSVTPDRRIHWNLGSLKSGQEKRIKFQLKPIQPGEIGSVAHVTFATQASMRTLVTKPVLEITHQTKPTVLIGSDVILDVVVTNKGDGAANNVLIQEDVPKQLEYQGGYRELEYEIGTLLPGQSKRVKLGLKAAEIGRTKNLMFASAAGGLRAQHEIELEVVAPRLTTAADGPTRRYLQREVAHQFKVGNQGTSPATNVDLIAKLPAGLRFVSANNQGEYKPASHAVVWSIAELGMNVNAAVELVTMPVDVGSQNIKFEAVADLNQKSAIEQELNVEHLIDVFFDIDDVVDPIEIGADTSYQIRIVNQGTQAATNVQLQIEFPNGLVPTAVEGNLQNQIQGQRIQFAPISSMKPGDQLQLLVRAKGQTAGDHRVIVVMQADGRQTPVSKEESTRVYADR